MKTKKGFFGIEFDPTLQPGHQTRNLQGSEILTGPKLRSAKPALQDGSVGPVKKLTDSQQKYGTGQVKELLPSVILRKKGRL